MVRLNSLRVQISLLVLLIFLPSFILILLTSADQERLAFEEAQEDVWTLTEIVAADNRQHIQSTRLLLTALAHIPSIREKRAEECNALLTDLTREYDAYNTLFLIDTDTHMGLCSGFPYREPIDNSQFVWYQNALESRDFTVSSYRIGPVTGQPNLTMSLPVFAGDGTMTAVIAAALSLQWLESSIKNTELRPNTSVTLIDAEGIVLARYPDTEGWVGQLYPNSVVREATLSHKAELIRSNDWQQKPRLYSYSSIGGDEGQVYVIVGLLESEVFADINQIRNRNLVVLGSVTVIIVLMAWLSSGVITRPIKRLTDASYQIATGQLSSRPDLQSDIIELQQLLTAFNTMADSIEKKMRERYEAEREARREAERLSHLKTRFLGMISHELRTPLTSIKGFVSSLLATDVTFSEEDRRVFLSIANEEADRLTSLIEQLLNLTRLQSGTLPIHQEATSFDEVLRVANGQLTALSAQHSLNTHIAPDLPPLFVDAERIAQVLVNLVGNAVKFSPPGTPITVEAESSKGRVMVKVSDQGIGIPIESREEIFEAFRQVDRKIPGQSTGAGLGLAICQGLVAAHGGRIWVEDGKTGGTTLVFTLPIAK